VTGSEPPEAWVLCVRGESFELGAPLSATSALHLAEAWTELLEFCRAAGSRAD
jgi:hypothetical protein